uniref:Uncharacterized protein n=1 Tax=Cacopsylla melanoneura TaxID=428564 RepID=A0A8D8VTV8_9HEMI
MFHNIACIVARIILSITSIYFHYFSLILSITSRYLFLLFSALHLSISIACSLILFVINDKNVIQEKRIKMLEQRANVHRIEVQRFYAYLCVSLSLFGQGLGVSLCSVFRQGAWLKKLLENANRIWKVVNKLCRYLRVYS